MKITKKISLFFFFVITAVTGQSLFAQNHLPFGSWDSSNYLVRVIFINIGQGKCILVTLAEETSSGTYGARHILADCGSNKNPPAGGSASKVAIDAISRVPGISDISHVVVTHWDTDHYSIISPLLRSGVGRLFNNATLYYFDHPSFITPKVTELLNLWNGLGSRKTSITSSYLLNPIVNEKPGKQAGISIAKPLQTPPTKAQEKNGHSIVLLGQLTTTRREIYRFLLTGDASWGGGYGNTEAEMLTGTYGNITLLDVPHHGSEYSSSTNFIENANPKLVVFSAGGKHHHPQFSALKRYMDVMEKRGFCKLSSSISIRAFADDGSIASHSTKCPLLSTYDHGTITYYANQSGYCIEWGGGGGCLRSSSSSGGASGTGPSGSSSGGGPVRSRDDKKSRRPSPYSR